MTVVIFGKWYGRVTKFVSNHVTQVNVGTNLARGMT